MPEQPPDADDLGRTASLTTDEPLTLPDAWTPAARPGLPVVAAVVPMVGGVAIWLVTGSSLALWLAAIGPLLALGTVLDGARTARRDRRRAAEEARRARIAVAEEVARRHGVERAERWADHPDAARRLASDAAIWRADPPGIDALVIGSGVRSSAVRVLGGRGDPESAELRADAARLTDAPVVVPPHAGVAVSGDEFAVLAVLRALAVQLLLSAAPGDMRLVGPASEHSWAEALPHRRAAGGRSLALVAPGEQVPGGADIVLARVAPGDPPPPRCAVLLRVRGLTRGTLDHAGRVHDVELEAVGSAQAADIATMLDARAGAAFGAAGAGEAVPFHALARGDDSVPGRLRATIGEGDRGPVAVDLVDDGPHAVVAGVTGSGKSELLTTWILALCAAHSTDEVGFLLADFKGGTAFDALRSLPHVTGVITDLDGSGARRAIESLAAEIRWRESALAAAGARDIADPRVEVPRLVIVVDEFAALLATQPELHAVFADVAARGRALGMHLILGTQRAAGVIRDALLTNCPLRISLRVTERADSRAVVGTDDAAEIPGGPGGRGIALVRRAADPAPVRVRIALSAPDDITAVAARPSGDAPRCPWLPPLPDRVRLDDLAPSDGGLLVLGLSDEPERQRQRPIGVRVEDRGVLVIGGPGTGRTTALETLARQARRVVRIGPSAEQAWDALERMEQDPPRAGTLVLADDLDAVLGRLPPEYAHEGAERFERVVRAAGAHGILVATSVQRLSGAIARIADLFPHRLLLPTATRADHVAAGGEPGAYAARGVPGRGTLDGIVLQVALAAPPDGPPLAETPSSPWHPRAPLTGFVSRRSPASRDALAAWEAGGHRVIGLDAFAAEGLPAATAVVVAGDPEQWQRHWRILGDVRADHDLVVDAPCGGELRALTGMRLLPPYAEPGRRRAWLLAAGGDPVRITLPAGDAGTFPSPPHR